jgi:hydroxymethylbilane synthase
LADRVELVIGTRGSPLAMAQAKEAQALLQAASGLSPGTTVLRPFTTTGDVIQDRSLADAGGKGLFTKELDAALLDRRIDLAVHSAKDLPTFLPPGLVIAGYLPREDVRDALISPRGASLQDLPAGTMMGTASPRRSAIVLRARPDIIVTLLRGNVGTRLAKLARGEVGATILALAGLKRLGLQHEATAILGEDEMLPAAGQGAIAITARTDDKRVRTLVEGASHAATSAAVAAERAFLAVLDGSCRTPIAGHATVKAGHLHFRGLIAKPDGSAAYECTREGAVADASALGADAGAELRRRAGADFFAPA